MQDIIEDLIRGVGYVALKLMSFGRYRGGDDGPLAEGAIGFAFVLGLVYLVYAVGAG